MIGNASDKEVYGLSFRTIKKASAAHFISSFRITISNSSDIVLVRRIIARIATIGNNYEEARRSGLGEEDICEHGQGLAIMGNELLRRYPNINAEDIITFILLKD